MIKISINKHTITYTYFFEIGMVWGTSKPSLYKTQFTPVVLVIKCDSTVAFIIKTYCSAFANGPIQTQYLNAFGPNESRRY